MNEILERVIYGLSLGMHNFIASFSLGLAIVLIILSVCIKKDDSKSIILKKVLDILLLSIGLSAISGLVFEIEFRRFWPDLLQSLESFNSNIGHKLAVISYLLSVPVFYLIYRYKSWKFNLLFPLLTIFLVFFVWTFSVWGVFLNTIMQFPLDTHINQHGILILNGSLWDRFFSGYHLNRQIHIAASSVLKTSVVLAIVFSIIKIEKHKIFKVLIYTGLGSIITLGISGHFQVLNIAKYQPSKFATMENVNSAHDDLIWKPVGYITPSGKEYAIKIQGGMLEILKDDIVPLDRQVSDKLPNQYLVYNSFRWMLYCAVIIFFSLIYWSFKKKFIPRYFLLFLLIINELGINSGWVLSEVGRQPWYFYGIMERTHQKGDVQIEYSVLLMFLNTVLLVGMSYFSFKIITVTKYNELA